MITTVTIIGIIIILVIYFSSMLFLLWRIDWQFDGGPEIVKKSDKIAFYICTYSPSNFVIMIAVLFVWGIRIIEDYIKIKKRKRKDIKERFDKIKLGIIRIDSIDPYGEENWNE